MNTYLIKNKKTGKVRYRKKYRSLCIERSM